MESRQNGGGGVKALADTSVKKVFYMPPKILIMLGYSNLFKFSNTSKKILIQYGKFSQCFEWFRDFFLLLIGEKAYIS